MAAWSVQQDALDKQLLTQLPHLLDPAVALHGKVRQHAASLLVADRPLPVHTAAVAGRDLVSAALATRPDEARAVISTQADNESRMLRTHRSVVAEFVAYQAAEHDEDRVRPACNMYLTIMEGEVRRVAAQVLRLLGHQVQPRATLGQLVQQLAGDTGTPMADLLRSYINRDWRNAVAHSNIHWDPKAQLMLLSGEPVTPEAVATATSYASAVCSGFETGVAVVLNHAGNPHYHWSRLTDETAWDSNRFRILGEHGVSATKTRRVGTRLELDMPSMTPSRVLTSLFVGILAASLSAPEPVVWIVRQARRPELAVDAATIDTAAEIVASRDDSSPGGKGAAAVLVITAGALRNHGTDPATAGRILMAFTCTFILSEHKRLSTRALLDDHAAMTEIARNMALLDDAVRCAAIMTDCTELETFATRHLAPSRTCHDWFHGNSGSLGGIKDALRATPPVELPWTTDEAATDNKTA